METLSHDLIQWGGIAGAIFAMWRLFRMIKEGAAKEATMLSEIQDLKAEVKRLQSDDSDTQSSVRKLHEIDAGLSERIAILEERTKP